MNRVRLLMIGFLLGLYVGWQWFSPESTPDFGPATNTRKAPPAEPDPLTDIEGIGPAYEQALNAVGILTFDQLAQQNADALAAQLGARITAERIRRDRWIEQAQERLAGN